MGGRCHLEERERSGRVLEREQENEDLEGGGYTRTKVRKRFTALYLKKTTQPKEGGIKPMRSFVNVWSFLIVERVERAEGGNVQNVKAMKNERGLAQGERSSCVKEGNPASTWSSDAVLGWKWRGRFLLKKGWKMEWKTKGLRMKVKHYLPATFSCRHR